MVYNAARPRVRLMPLPLIVNGIDRSTSETDICRIVRQTFERATDGCSWLKRGDTVLLKVSLNSPDPYPATTSPLAVRAVVQALQERGARVIVGDMPGIEYVLVDPRGNQRQSARSCFERSGMAACGAVEFIGFEERGWDGFFHFSSPAAVSWPDGFHATSLIHEVDHIVALPRLSTHIHTGVTLGFKVAVGYLRADSRMVFHRDGPFFLATKRYVHGTQVPTQGSSQRRFFEKITEINLAVADRQRLVLCLGTEAQVSFGPDRKMVGFQSCRVAPEVGLVFASANPVAFEVMGIAALTLLFQAAPWHDRWLQKALMLVNGRAHRLGSQAVWANPFVRHALKIGLGTAEFDVQYTDVPQVLQVALDKQLAAGRP
jgi:uncharacterized protein (DUF362 family)